MAATSGVGTTVAIEAALVTAVTSRPPDMRVLVVEDDRDTREIVRLILELEGLEVHDASDGLEALERLQQLRTTGPDAPCVVILDLMMPRCTGAEFRRRQLADPLLADVPVILLSAIADLPCFEGLGAFARLSKPFDPEQLARIVRSACPVRR